MRKNHTRIYLSLCGGNLFVVVSFQLENYFQPAQKNKNSEQYSEELFRKKIESKLRVFCVKHFEVIKVNCGELKEGQRLSCEGCGFELKVVNACGDNSCSTEACCNGNIQCCGEP